MGFGGERQRLQLLGVGRQVATVRSVRMLSVRRGRRGRRGQRCCGRGRRVQRGGGAGLRQVRVRQVRDSVRLRRLGAGLRGRGLVGSAARGPGPFQLRGHVLDRNFMKSFTLGPLSLLLLTVVVTGRPAWVQLGVDQSLLASHLVIFGLLFFGQ